MVLDLTWLITLIASLAAFQRLTSLLANAFHTTRGHRESSFGKPVSM